MRSQRRLWRRTRPVRRSLRGHAHGGDVHATARRDGGLIIYVRIPALTTDERIKSRMGISHSDSLAATSVRPRCQAGIDQAATELAVQERLTGPAGVRWHLIRGAARQSAATWLSARLVLVGLHAAQSLLPAPGSPIGLSERLELCLVSLPPLHSGRVLGDGCFASGATLTSRSPPGDQREDTHNEPDHQPFDQERTPCEVRDDRRHHHLLDRGRRGSAGRGRDQATLASITRALGGERRLASTTAHQRADPSSLPSGSTCSGSIPWV
jgi:hypothetical protein